MKKILLFTVLTLFITGLILLVIERNDKFTDYIDNIEIVPLSKEELVYSYNFKPIEQFKPSSCSIQPYGKGYIMNIRYINYSFNKEGIIYYHYPDKVCKTKNVYVFLDESYKAISNPVVLKEVYTKYQTEFIGLEDIRLFYHQNKLKCIASCGNITNDGKIVITIGDYDIKNKLINNLKIIKSPYNSNMEKNWIFVNEQYLLNLDESKNKMNFIYDWSPFQIGYINNESQLHIYKKYNVPNLFKRFRGSTIVVEYNGFLWCLVHYLKTQRPRRVYHHCLVQLEYGTLKPISITNPFVFLNKGIEYCIGFEIKNDIAIFIFSSNDSNPSPIQKDMDTFILNRI